jgi:plasmid stabilization system protein ParE
MAKLFYTPRALRLIDEAHDFSIINFGYERTLQYANEMQDSFDKIAEEHEKISKKKTRDHLTGNSGLSIHPVGKYYAVFTVVKIHGEDAVIILDLPGQEQDLPNILHRNMAIFRRELVQLVARLEREQGN